MPGSPERPDRRLLALACLLAPVACASTPSAVGPPALEPVMPISKNQQRAQQPHSPRATSDSDGQETRAALARLRSTLGALAGDSRFALGHEDSSAYGVRWSEEPARSDVKSVCGDYPAVYGWDLFRIENGARENGDGVRFELMRTRVQEAYRRGGINTISWHADNPVSGGDAWDTTRAVEHIIPGGNHHQDYVHRLDKVADFLESCRGDRGEKIPIIFRPFHEHTGNWFWWGASHTTDRNYIALWRFTVDYLRNERGLSELLFAFSPGGDGLDSEQDYLFRYPGDGYVDVMGVDQYYDDDVSSLLRSLRIVVGVAESRGKLAALTEFGVRDGLSEMTPPDWFSHNFFLPLVEDPIASRIAYALAWRNANPDHFFLPYPGHQTEKDFQRVCSDPRLLLERDLPRD